MSAQNLVAGALALAIVVVGFAVASFILEAATLEIATPKGVLRARRVPELG